ncbi:MAG: hypothetical protein KDD64_13330 [Bdellovibrionales bacterium]|nr:hypothetical protein [Bdellovibrionales bacterium]
MVALATIERQRLNIAEQMQAASEAATLLRISQQDLSSESISADLRALAQQEVGEVQVSINPPGASIASQAFDGVELGINRAMTALATSTEVDEEPIPFARPNLATLPETSFTASGLGGVLDTSSLVPQASLYFLEEADRQAGEAEESAVIAKLQRRLSAESAKIAA